MYTARARRASRATRVSASGPAPGSVTAATIVRTIHGATSWTPTRASMLATVSTSGSRYRFAYWKTQASPFTAPPHGNVRGIPLVNQACIVPASAWARSPAPGARCGVLPPPLPLHGPGPPAAG